MAGPGSAAMPGLPPLPGAPRVMRPNMPGGTPVDAQGRGVPRTASSEQIGATDTTGFGRGRPVHMRAGSGDQFGAPGRPGSPAVQGAVPGMAGPSPLGARHASPAHVEGTEAAGLDGEPKRGRKRGFSDGPEGPEGAALGRPGARLPAGALPYSYRHGSALLLQSRAEPPPPPLDAEELFELLELPMVLVEREAGYRDPVPTVLPPQPGPSDPPFGVHGSGTDIEVVFAVGVFDTDWVAAAAAHHAARRDRERDRDWRRPSSPEPGECPLSPANLPEVYTPVHEDVAAQELAAEKEWQARQVALKAQQRQMMMGYMGNQRPPGVMSGYTQQGAGMQQGPGMQHTSSGSGGIGSVSVADVHGLRPSMVSTGSMPVIMDLRASANMGSTPGPGAGMVPLVQDLRAALGPTPNWRTDTPPPSHLAGTPMPRISALSPMPPITSLSAAATPIGMQGPPVAGDVAMQDAQPPITDPECEFCLLWWWWFALCLSCAYTHGFLIDAGLIASHT